MTYGPLGRGKLLVQGGFPTFTRRRRGAGLGNLRVSAVARGERLEARLALVSLGTHPSVGLAIDRSQVGWLGRRDGAGLVMRLRCGHACSLFCGQVWALNGSRAM